MPYIPKIKIGNTEYNLKDTEARTQIATTNTNLTNTINSTKTSLQSTINSTKTSLQSTINSTKTSLQSTIDSTSTTLNNTINSTKNDLKSFISVNWDRFNMNNPAGTFQTGLYATVEKDGDNIIASATSGRTYGCALLHTTEMSFMLHDDQNFDSIVLGVSIISQQYYAIALSFNNGSFFGELVGYHFGPNTPAHVAYDGVDHLGDSFHDIYFSLGKVKVDVSYKGDGKYSITITNSTTNESCTKNLTLASSNIVTVNGQGIGFGYQDLGFIVDSSRGQATLSLSIEKEKQLAETQWTNKNWFHFGDTVVAFVCGPVKNNTGLTLTEFTHPRTGFAQLKDSYTKMIGTGVTPDLITISAGGYDFFGDVAISEMETGLRTILNGLYTAFPKALIIIITPIPTTKFDANAQDKYMVDYVAAIKAIAEEYLTPCLDLYSCAGINSLNASAKLMSNSGAGILNPNYVVGVSYIISQFILRYGPMY